MAKNTPQTFNEGFLVELLHYNEKGGEDYVGFIVRALWMIKELSGNKDYLVASKIRIGAIFESPQIDKVLETVLLSNHKDNKIAEVIL